MNLHRLDLVSLPLFSLVLCSSRIRKGAELAHLAVGAASKRITDLETPSAPSCWSATRAASRPRWPARRCSGTRSASWPTWASCWSARAT